MAGGLTERGEAKVDRDPDAVSKDELLRENYWLREVIETRLAGSDKALELLQARADKVPSEMDLAIDRLKELHETKFKAHEDKFIAADKNVVTALSAAKELSTEQNKASAAAIAKSEDATNKQLASISQSLSAVEKTKDGEIGDLKERVGAIENTKKGGDNVWAFIVAGIGALEGVAGIVALILK